MEEMKMREIAWNKYDEQKMKEVMDFSEGYKKFISECKTERECVTESIKWRKHTVIVIWKMSFAIRKL